MKACKCIMTLYEWLVLKCLCCVVLQRLAKLVKSRTYLDWPEDEAERVNFWERLRRNIVEEDRVSV